MFVPEDQENGGKNGVGTLPASPRKVLKDRYPKRMKSMMEVWGIYARKSDYLRPLSVPDSALAAHRSPRL